MPRQSTERTDQHYVPQFLLRGFAGSGKRKQVYVFDKSNDNEFCSSVRNLACERDFYDHDLDQWLTRLEDTSAPIIESIRKKRTLNHLQHDERQWLAGFIAAQHVRTLHHRAVFADINAQMADAIREQGTDPNSVKNFRELSHAENREATNSEIVPLAFKLLPYILNKSWILFLVAPGTEFWIGDHPVTLANNMNPGDGLRGTLGFGVVGIEIYLPISSELMLGCLCHSIRAMFAASHDGILPPAPRAESWIRKTSNTTIRYRSSAPSDLFTVSMGPLMWRMR
jgi:hypothetical protein